jgi:hypothetical protein
MGIILEDDCIPDPSFFQYCEELLNRYKDDPRIATISGNSVAFQKREYPYSYRFTQYMNMWGWATWRRTYSSIDNELKLWHSTSNHRKLLKKSFSTLGSPHDPKWIEYWYSHFKRTADGEIDTWDYQWIFNILASKRLSISPSVNLVENIGWGPGATHTHEANDIIRGNLRNTMAFPLKHPTELKPDITYEAHIKEVWCDLTHWYKNIYLPNYKNPWKEGIKSLLQRIKLAGVARRVYHLLKATGKS